MAAHTCLDRCGPIETKADLVKHPFIRVKGILANEQLPLQSEDKTLESARIQTVTTTSHWRPMFDTILAGGGLGVVQAPARVNARAHGKSRAPHHHACR
ncbi:hypothetical protein QZM18_06485 [Burkholderia diffusa]|uniref:hypothetical protein n=1 Tax=Burkholderia diffusa TaxID=488732 RepID=UPI00264F00C0|nr:hypothetical protein [Burkholderia diffusa]MDN7903778.1 hypothetical protein [Burkholderia diffusa]